VQGELEATLERLAGEPVRVTLAGRTDSGVHAWGQVASLDFPQKPRLGTPESVLRALNGILPEDIAATSAEIVPEGFHARFSARRRAYRYLLWNAPSPAPLFRRYSLHVRQPLDTRAMSQAASLLVGTLDLAAFAGNGMGMPDDDDGGKRSTIRAVYLSRFVRLDPKANFWAWDAPQQEDSLSPHAHEARRTEARTQVLSPGLWALDLVANAFLPQMIRTMMGTLLEIGLGKRTVENMKEVIESRDRRKAGQTARPQGLCLLWVEY
jgi:tRNA pseudouridine38-40 synthase